MRLSLTRLIETGHALDFATPGPPCARDPDGMPTHRPARPRVARTVEAPTLVPVRPALEPARSRGPTGAASSRRHVRVRYHLAVTVYGGGGFWAGVVNDLSESGASILCTRPPPLDTTVQLRLDLPEVSLEVRGVVRWRRVFEGDRDGMGIELLDLPETDRRALRQFVAADPAPHGPAQLHVEASDSRPATARRG